MVMSSHGGRQTGSGRKRIYNSSKTRIKVWQKGQGARSLFLVSFFWSIKRGWLAAQSTPLGYALVRSSVIIIYFVIVLFLFYSEQLDEALRVLNQDRDLDQSESESEEEQTLW